jgi:hypothetical protein
LDLIYTFRYVRVTVLCLKKILIFSITWREKDDWLIVNLKACRKKWPRTHLRVLSGCRGKILRHISVSLSRVEGEILTRNNTKLGASPRDI